MADLHVKFAGVMFKNPVVVASGTFGNGREYAEYYDLSELGGICTKGLTPQPRLGNRSPRIAETTGGMLNSVGLQNVGVDEFIANELPFLRRYDTRVIANFSAESIEDFGIAARKLSDAGVDMLEVNVSCPNVNDSGMLFGVSASSIAAVTAEVKLNSSVPVMVKLTPNVTDIAEMARAAEGAGADAISLINTLLGMRIDVNTRRPILANNTGGLSGAAVFPVAVRMVWQVRNAVKIPILGMGGIFTAEDAAEMMIAGADMVAVGTANFTYPDAALRVRNGLIKYLDTHGIEKVTELSGSVVLN